MTRIFSALPAASALALAGCVAPMLARIHSAPERVPAGARLPLRVGLLISNETLNFQAHAKIPLGEWLYPFGRDLPTVAEQTLSQVFARVTPVETADFRSYDLIVEPRFDAAATHVDMSLTRCRVVVAMTFAASDASGVKWSKDVVGEVVTDGGIDAMRARHGQAVSKAVLAAAVAMREDLAAVAPRAAKEPVPAAAAAPDSWWAKPAGAP